MDAGDIAILIPFGGLLIGLVAVIGGQNIARQKLKLKQIEAAAAATDAGALEATNREVERLRKRVAVLEKLVTDDDRRLGHEIEQLRRDEHGSGA